jgi:hypothetical protein
VEEVFHRGARRRVCGHAATERAADHPALDNDHIQHVASVLAAAAAYLVQLGLGQALDGKLYDPVALATGGLVFVVIYVVAARRLRVREIDDLVGPVLELVRRTVSRSPRR